MTQKIKSKFKARPMRFSGKSQFSLAAAAQLVKESESSLLSECIRRMILKVITHEIRSAGCRAVAEEVNLFSAARKAKELGDEKSGVTSRSLAPDVALAIDQAARKGKFNEIQIMEYALDAEIENVVATKLGEQESITSSETVDLLVDLLKRSEVAAGDRRGLTRNEPAKSNKRFFDTMKGIKTKLGPVASGDVNIRGVGRLTEENVRRLASGAQRNNSSRK